MNRRLLPIITAVAMATALPLSALAQWTGAPGTPPNSNAKGPVWLQSTAAAPTAQTGRINITEGRINSATHTQDLYIATGKALRSFGANAGTINFGNFETGATSFTLGVQGVLNVPGFSGGTSGQICLNGSCISAWPGAVSDIWVNNTGDTMTGDLILSSPARLCLGGVCQGSWPSSGGTIGGSGTAGYVPRFTNGTTLGNSTIQDNGSTVGMGTSPTSFRQLNVLGVGSAVYGQSTGPDGTGGSYGVQGNAPSSGFGAGVYGQGGNYGTLGQGSVVGAVGNTNSGVGVLGQALSNGSAVRQGNTGVQGFGGTYGVYGSVGGNGVGTYGGSGSGGIGVYGQGGSIGTYGTGQTGISGNGSDYGVYGQGGTYGVYGGGSSYGVYGNGPQAGLYGQGQGYGAMAYGNSFGVYGRGESNFGVVGSSGSWYGVQAVGGTGGFYTDNSTNYFGGYLSVSAGMVYVGPNPTELRIVNPSGYNNTHFNYANSAANYIRGTTYIDNYAGASDIRLKDVHASFTRGLDAIATLNPFTYNYKKGTGQMIPEDGKERVGVAAQDVKKVIPEAVFENKDGYLMLNTDPVIWTLVNSVKELKAENDALKARVEKLEAK